MSSSWPSLSAFYADDLRRGRSHELQFGSMWMAKLTEPPWRAGWLETTGEFFVILYESPHVPDPGPVEVLGVLPDRLTVEVGLRGWWHTCGFQGSLTWLRNRVNELAAPVQPALVARMLWIVDAPQRSVIVAARSAAAARAAVWQAGPAAYASDEETRQLGDVVVVADAVAPAEAERLQRLGV